MKEIMDFLSDLKRNNNRDWFEANKARYKQVQQQFEVLTQRLIDGVLLFDPSVAGVSVKDCTYRIYRDVRFSPNKEPYKTHMGAYVCPKGKKSGYSGYYFHLEPESSILAVGLHCPQPNIIRSVRDEIYDNGAAFVSTMNTARDFTLDMSTSLKKTPKGYPKDSPFDKYLKLKDFTLIMPLTADEGALEYALREFRTTCEFNALLNRAVRFAYEEDPA